MNFRTLAIHNMLRLYKNVGQTAYSNPKLARVAFERLADVIPGKLPECNYQSITIGDLPAEWITPKRSKADKVLLFLHGGGYATGSLRTHRALASQIAIHARIKALSIEYKLAPEHKFPTQIEQAVAAYQFLLEQGYLPEDIAIGGESAGGGLTGGTLLYLKDHDIPLPACAIFMSPWFDLTGSGRSLITNKHKDPMVPYKGIPLWARNYAGDAELTNPYASPLFGDLKGLCPVYIQVGECEILLSDSTRYAEKAKNAGVDVTMEVWPNMFHAWQGFWMIIPEGKAAIEKLGAFLRKNLRILEPKNNQTLIH
jgi:acetyl esterase/lipase